MKDHEIASLVNEVRDIAVEFHATQQLRDRISRVIVPPVARLQQRLIDAYLLLGMSVGVMWALQDAEKKSARPPKTTMEAEEKLAAIREAVKQMEDHRAVVSLFVYGCRKCGGEMRPGQAIQETYTAGAPDFPGDRRGVTLSAGGPGRLVSCMKCSQCGWSVT